MLPKWRKRGKFRVLWVFINIISLKKHYTGRILAQNDDIFKILCTFALIYNT